MNEINNIPQLISAEQLKEIYAQHRYDKRRYRYFDREGRLAWSNKEGYNQYTWYLYNNEGEIIEMGESYINAGALGHVLTVYQCTTAEAGDFIRNKAGRDNVLRIAPPGVVDSVEIQVAQPVVTPTIICPVAIEIYPIPYEDLRKVTRPLSQADIKIETVVDPATFADKVLAAIFAAPQQEEKICCSGLLPFAPQHIFQDPVFHAPAHYCQTITQYASEQSLLSVKAPSQSLNAIFFGTSHIIRPAIQNSS